MFFKGKGKEELIAGAKEETTGWQEKSLCGQYPLRINRSRVACWRWLNTGYMKKETERLLMAAQDQALATRN